MDQRERLLRRLAGAARRLRGRRPDAAQRPTGPPSPAPPALTPADYRPLHPELGRFDPAMLNPGLEASLEALRPDLFALRPLSEGTVAALLEEVNHLRAWAREHRVYIEPPNSMNDYGVVLETLGLGGLAQGLMEAAVSPLAARLFPEVGGASLSDSHAFVVEYERGGDVDLGFHVDDSDVTLNLCLGERPEDGGFEGGELYFQGRRCALHRQTGCAPEEHLEVAHEPGVALLHAGKHRHGAWPLRSGRRVNLILWCRSPAWRAEEAALEAAGGCPPWCGVGLH
jgi:hypothetical protein